MPSVLRVASLAAAMLVGAAPSGVLAQASQPSSPPDDDEAFFARAATCAAALEADQLTLVERARAGVQGLRPDMVRVTQLGFTYVGKAYLRGLRDPRASQMLKAAKAEQQSWPAARHVATVTQCSAEASTLYDDASSMEQWLVRRKANGRVDKFLATLPPAPASR